MFFLSIPTIKYYLNDIYIYIRTYIYIYIIYIYVTVSAKTSLVCTKILIHCLAQLIAVLNSYPHSTSPMGRLKWSAFLRGGLTAL